MIYIKKNNIKNFARYDNLLISPGRLYAFLGERKIPKVWNLPNPTKALKKQIGTGNKLTYEDARNLIDARIKDLDSKIESYENINAFRKIKKSSQEEIRKTEEKIKNLNKKRESYKQFEKDVEDYTNYEASNLINDLGKSKDQKKIDKVKSAVGPKLFKELKKDDTFLNYLTPSTSNQVSDEIGFINNLKNVGKSEKGASIGKINKEFSKGLNSEEYQKIQERKARDAEIKRKAAAEAAEIKRKATAEAAEKAGIDAYEEYLIFEDMEDGSVRLITDAIVTKETLRDYVTKAIHLNEDEKIALGRAMGMI